VFAIASLCATVSFAIDVLDRHTYQTKFDVLGVRSRESPTTRVWRARGEELRYRTESIESMRTCALIIDVMLALTINDSPTARSMMSLLESTLSSTQVDKLRHQQNQNEKCNGANWSAPIKQIITAQIFTVIPAVRDRIRKERGRYSYYVFP
jgi:hypothetical protein